MSLGPVAPPEGPRRDLVGYWIGFNRVHGIGVVRLKRLIDAFGDVRTAWEAPASQLAATGLQGRTLEGLLEARRRFDPERETNRLEAAGISVLTIDDDSYPRRLREIYAAPPVLFVRGQVDALAGSVVAVVGTRHATGYGRAVTERLAGDLARAGVTIVSGFARGIDSVAHRAALEAGGRTVGVFASGLDTVYPPENRFLVEEVIRTGALLSEHPLGVRPEATNFPARNRIVSGLAQATIVVEAGERSGALITASFALDQGRDVLAVPGPITSPRSVGTNRLIQDGARLVTCADDVLAEIGVKPSAASDVQLDLAAGLTVDAVEAAVLTCLTDGPMTADDLTRALQRPIQDVGMALTMLELRGRTRQVNGLNYIVQR